MEVSYNGIITIQFSEGEQPEDRDEARDLVASSVPSAFGDCIEVVTVGVNGPAVEAEVSVNDYPDQGVAVLPRVADAFVDAISAAEDASSMGESDLPNGINITHTGS